MSMDAKLDERIQKLRDLAESSQRDVAFNILDALHAEHVARAFPPITTNNKVCRQPGTKNGQKGLKRTSSS